VPIHKYRLLPAALPASSTLCCRSSLDDAQEATWRASGQHLKLQWLSPPSTVLVVYKPVPAVFTSCVRAIAWLLRRGLTVYVEPGVHAELAAAVQQHLDSAAADSGGSGAPNGSAGSAAGTPLSSMDSHDDGFPAPAAGAVANQAAAATALRGRPAAAAGDVDLSRQLLTWPSSPCGCPPAVPCSVGLQVDLVITLGGDGTVLWTCGLFAAGAVPPLVPFAMGSLGFMTPFEIGRMEAVLGRVTGMDRGVPLMLRHRLRCRIIRGGGGVDASSPDLAAAAAAVAGAGPSADNAGATAGADTGGSGGGSFSGGLQCLEEFVVLNEMVIDRGMKAQLCNLQVRLRGVGRAAVQGAAL
jgi:NAD+ kinase